VGPWGTLILVFVGMWMVQVVLTWRQSKHYSVTIREMSAYGPGYLGVGVAKRKLGVGSVVVVVTDFTGKVVEAREMSGVTIFARFRKDVRLIGKSIEALSMMSGTDSRISAVRMAVERIRVQQCKEAERQEA
jgi:glucitol operon activator protein